MRSGLLRVLLAGLLLTPILAVAADEPPPGWHGSLGAGLSLSSGNTDAKSYNVSIDVKWDPKTRNVLKLGALYLRSDAAGAVTADKLSALVRDEYSLTDRYFVYGEVGYLRDRIALLTYLLSPTAGVGYKVVKTDAVLLDVSGGLGGAFEKYEAKEATSGGAYRAGQSLTWKISPQVAFGQKASALWKSRDTSDAYYHLDASLTTSVSKLLELKVAYLLDHKTRPAASTLEKTDTTFLLAIVAKF